MKFLTSLSMLVLVALVAGLVVGALATAFGGDAARAVITQVEGVGGLWLNALRMTVVPLIFAVLVGGVAQVADLGVTGRLALRAAVVFAILLVVSSALAVAWVSGLLAAWPLDPVATAALRAGAHAPDAAAATPPDFATWLRSLAPANPLKAAAEEQILPLVVFALFTGFAITRLPEARARALTEVVAAIGDAMIVVVRWVLIAAPVGVFCLGLGVGLRAGAGAAGLIGQYVVIAASTGALVTLLGYGFALGVARAPARRWFQASSPVVATAVATQSSLACLPAMIERSRDDLGVPARIADLALPLAVAVFRITSPAVNLAVCLFIATVHGIHLAPGQYVAGILVALAMAVGTVGLPGQISFIITIAPICAAMGLPIDLLPILLAVEVAPDIFRTIGNVVSDMAVTAFLARDELDEAA